MKILKKVGCFLYQYIEEAIAMFLLSIQFSQLASGLYEEAMQGLSFSLMFIMAVIFQRESQKSKKAYMELWSKISACTQVAEEQNKDLILRRENKDTITMKLSPKKPILHPDMRRSGNGKTLYCNSCGKKQ